jgi:hypothetical protein
MKLKTNEQITEAFEIEENENLEILKKQIIKHNEILKKLQKEHRVKTGKKYFYLLTKTEKI